MAHANSKRCQRCAALLPFADFNRKARASDGLQEWCRACQAAHAALYRRAPRVKRRRAEAASAYRADEANREKLAARARVQAAKRKGTLQPTERCQDCFALSPRLHADHYLGYAPEHALTVRWICPRCDGRNLAPMRTVSARRRSWAIPLFPESAS